MIILRNDRIFKFSFSIKILINYTLPFHLPLNFLFLSTQSFLIKTSIFALELYFHPKSPRFLNNPNIVAMICNNKFLIIGHFLLQ